VQPLAASDFSRYVVLLPALIVGVGLILGILILLGRAFAQTVRESTHPRWIVAGLVALAGAVVLLTWLGVQLPRE
jgi:zinc transporter ZupT